MKRQRKEHSKPRKPWEESRIKEESHLIKKYGLKNKKEIWKMESKLRKFRRQARKLIGQRGQENFKNKKEKFLKKIMKLGLIKEEDIEAVLNINLKDLMNRRLQTCLFQSGMVKTPKQARQAIVHGHVLVGGKKITSPSYLIKKGEEEKIKFAPESPLANSAHPIRTGEENG